MVKLSTKRKRKISEVEKVTEPEGLPVKRSSDEPINKKVLDDKVHFYI